MWDVFVFLVFLEILDKDIVSWILERMLGDYDNVMNFYFFIMGFS